MPIETDELFDLLTTMRQKQRDGTDAREALLDWLVDSHARRRAPKLVGREETT